MNKLTPQKFKTLVEQIMALSIDTSERLEGVIDRIFEKVQMALMRVFSKVIVLTTMLPTDAICYLYIQARLGVRTI